MIIKQYLDVIEGRKTQTRRMKGTYKVGSVQSVVPKMYKPTVWYRWYDGELNVNLEAIEHKATFNAYHSETDYDNTIRVDHREALSERGFIPLQIRIVAKRQEPLQCLTVDDAIAEGVYWNPAMSLYTAVAHGHTFADFSPIDCYAQLWDSINTKKGLRWEDNPTVVVYCFEVVKE